MCFPILRVPGTPAARMPQVDGRAIKHRAARLRETGAARVQQHLAAQVGQTHEILMEGPQRGRTRQFTEVALSTPRAAGEMIEARITGYADGMLSAD